MSNVGGRKGLRRSERHQRGAAPSSSCGGRGESVSASRGGRGVAIILPQTSESQEKEEIHQEEQVHEEEKVLEGGAKLDPDAGISLADGSLQQAIEESKAIAEAHDDLRNVCSSKES